MEETANTDLLFLELRQKLQSGLLFIGSDVIGDGADVKIESKPESILNIQTRDRSFEVTLAPGVSLVETQKQKSPANSEQGSHYRLRLKVEHPSDPSLTMMMEVQVVNVSLSCLIRAVSGIRAATERPGLRA
ncbi:E3 ubiquitin-protein ligase E3D [Danio aesculapii]|uniref:E3 ubiquitin-protein ligase E3D n=1 Tax=Danio aesculapii TaxID=1142201 RepID=UPI0024BF7508|nr:E3 ubiquitin-protein ligase E3D [Danio aesculapii]